MENQWVICAIVDGINEQFFRVVDEDELKAMRELHEEKEIKIIYIFNMESAIIY